MNIVLFGAPGAGKGTQSELLVKNLKMYHISTGDLLRDAVKRETPLGVEAKKFMNAGQLVPDSVMIGLIESKCEELKKNSFILDGFPRTIPQAEALKELLARFEMKISKAIFVEVPFSDLITRLSGRRVCDKCASVYHISNSSAFKDGKCSKCGGNVVQRADDAESVIKKRLETYMTNTNPLREYYKSERLYYEVSGVGPTEVVYSRITNLMS